jgi:acetyl esterase/lipase
MRSRIYRSLLRRILKERELSLDEIREGGGLKSLPPAILPGGTSIEPVAIGGMEAEWIVPSLAEPGLAMLHLHGGGYVSGSAELHRMLTAWLARSAGARVLAPNYRLAPEHPFPAALDDALAAYRFILSSGYSSRRLAVSGDSAGGGLVLAMVMRLRDAGEPLPAAIVLMSPWTDLELKNPSCRDKAEVEALLKVDILREWAAWYAGGENLASALLSPVNGDFSGFPPMLIQVGSEEILLDDSRILARKAAAAGAAVKLSVWDGLWHCWQALGGLVPENDDSFAEVEAFLLGHFVPRSLEALLETEHAHGDDDDADAEQRQRLGPELE